MKKLYITSILASILVFSCTDIEENVYDKYSANDFYGSEEGSNAALASVYAQLPGNWNGVGYAGADRGWYDLNSMSSDEQVIPHRNTGDWELDFARLYKREWLPSDGFISNTWNWLYRSIFLANLAIEQLEGANAEASKIAEAHVLRAFYYYLLIDDFGDVPFYTENNLAVDQIPQESREYIFNFLVEELNNYVEDLSPSKGGDYYGRFNKWAGYALLAKLYLNAEVYTGTPMYTECLEVCNKIDEGGFSLHSSAEDSNLPLGSKYYELFGDIAPDDETILAIYTTVDVVGRNIFSIRSLGGTDGTLLVGYGAWNGSVVPKDFVEKFDDNDIRKRQFRYGADPYGPKPAGFINYSLDIDNLDNPGADRNAGARNLKFWPVEPMNSGGASNDFPIYRYADILLMKAECLVRTNNASAAKPFIDQVRERAGLNALASEPTLEDIYNERGFELAWEGHRRQDMIRFGTFTETHGLAPAVDDHFLLFPIPTSALNANSNLVQNPGY
ncbi:RagB/SusD family nutrient uptake outer membrane protein [Marinigracilibium pacificum]|uniref:RagB/SusD family nutrient uptake outer membrane protein n=1 Tax=Marinigracilibium pacificum TaxID=2729599 RepID=A0A848IYF1_9BACT|nr:RagB/SusD family nutrient uptake outer membrane protein [Marinigracilibium pacificum]NMM49533.1 RagB/SusD family nutrient uptake outer membrane protein [Marinigracilibium pacificum]